MDVGECARGAQGIAAFLGPVIPDIEPLFVAPNRNGSAPNFVRI